MKQETNNEMDLLLRRLGRRQDVFAPDAEDHLDADELNAYSENALPVKTRARYTEHLAECSRCREFVVQLSASAGVMIAEQSDKISATSGWKRFLASLISPMVLRYAAPALGLVVIAVIGVVVLRQNKSGEYVSQVQERKASGSVAAEQTSPNEAGANTYDNSSTTVNSVNKETVAKNAPQPSPTPVPQATPADVEQDAPVAKAPAAKPESQPASAEPPAPAPAKLDAADEKRQKSEDAARTQEDEVKVAPKEVASKNFELGRVAKKPQEPATMRARAAKNKTEVSDAVSTQGAAAAGGPRREEAGRDDKDSAETRSVGGRQFRKRGGIWTDTAYDGSKAMNLNRNSESYRTLVADEPAIKTIADQLDGEIIVVWKNRPYHIY